MFDIGFAELLIIVVVALIVLGPEKLPTAIKTLGLWVGRIRRTVTSIQSEISEELRVEEMKRTAAISKEELDKELKEMSQPFIDTLDVDSPMEAKASTPEKLQAEASADKQEIDASAKETQKTQEKS